MIKQTSLIPVLCLSLFFIGCQRKSSVMTQIITDVEGNWERLLSQANSPEAVLIINSDGTGEIKKNGRIRFLGDTTDKGPNNFKVITFILNLKKNYPDRVELIIGNRDLNKLRFNWELTPSALDLRGDETRDDGFRIYEWKTKWDKWIADGKNKIDGVVTAYTHGENPVTDQILKMKWMLSETMGAAELFDAVKKELNFATDALTCQELQKWARPGGLWVQYLELAEIVYYDADIGALYMHGGISDTDFGVVPGQQKRYEIIQPWMSALNAWGKKVVHAGISGDVKEAIAGAQYQEPEIIVDANGHTKWGTPNPKSVIHGRPWSADYNIKPIDPATAQTLKSQGVNYVCSGHSPIGQIAVMIRSSNGLIAVFCDTSATQNPPRGSVVILTKDTVTIYSDLYDANGKNHRIISRSSDPAVGTQVDGILVVNDMLSASWSRAQSGVLFGNPNYIFKIKEKS
jgi:hypothetical protein